MSVLSSILANSTRPPQPFILLQSSAAQSSLPVLNSFISKAKGTVVLACFLYSPKIFIKQEGVQQQIDLVDCREYVLEYHDEADDWKDNVFKSLQKLDSSSPLTVVIDSIETLLSNASNSVCSVYAFLSEILGTVQSHKGHSRLIIHGVGSSPLTSLLSQPSFSSTMVHIISHPPVLLTHLSRSYSLPPPPLTPPERFWSVFSPIADREHEGESLVFGSDGEGDGGDEIILELVVRGTGEGRRRAVERDLEGWKAESGLIGPCELKFLQSLGNVWTRKGTLDEATPDPTKNVSFNLKLTPEQQQSRAQVPLPYVHDGAPNLNTVGIGIPEGSILYDPDSADDVDDDDPDEDLDI
ncbi:hypothetical protein BDY19DRAFT_34947 [Irpex rosettiformis]|uniref:Uncharacterized protein n=1 Tax=Irpex rosettiformis TaxID=378272 RepID=A0ACB8UJU7_9APHY|nr:hypothetical protein BDY19DRAFT_34947 [Irpex rosettiformis]